MWLAVMMIALSAIALFALHRAKAKRPPPQDVIVDLSEGFVDITLPVVSKHCDRRGGCVLETEGLYKGQSVGLRLVVAGGMKESAFTDNHATSRVEFLSEGVTLLTSGLQSEALVRLIAASYGKPVQSLKLPIAVKTTAVPLEGNPAEIQTRPVKFKLFHGESEDSPDYFELYLNADLANDRVQLDEKDAGYRSGVLKAFGAE